MPNIVRFDSYEVDLSARQLYKHGIRISLRDKSFQVLASLLEHAGEVVTREDLCHKLWREEVFVDFDNNLNTAIARLREALCDSADHPQFVETLPKRGYRFLASISQAPRPRQDKIRMVVLPFINLSGDPGQEYFNDAITDEIISALAALAPERLAVIARTTAMRYKGADKDVSRIGRDLDVDYLVEGGVRRTRNQVLINVQLIQVSDQTHVFAKRYDARASDIFNILSKAAEEIAAHFDISAMPRVGAEVYGPAQASLQKKSITARSVDPEVYDTTLRGKATLEYATRELQVRLAIELFQQGIDRDPTYAPAWAGLGEALWYLAAGGLEFVAPTDVRDKSIAAAEKALELDATLPDAHKARAAIAMDAEWDLTKAQSHFEKVLELQPGHAAAHNLYGQLFAVLGRFADAQCHFNRARELDPLSPWNDINLLGWWMLQGRPERALEEGERARRCNPTVWTICCLLGNAHVLLGQPEQAVPDFEAALKLVRPERPSALLAPLGLACGLAGCRDRALAIRAEMEQTSQKRYVSPFYLAVVHSGLERMDEAFQFLERALEQRTPYLICCTRNDGNSLVLRRDPRWGHFANRLRQFVKLPADTPDPYS